jgi:branched-chain amino acid transport system substrate-binding protein
MSSLPPDTFSSLLRRYRQAAGLTQEALAERAHLSVQAIGALERGVRQAPHRQTFELLAQALALSEDEHTTLAHAAQASRARRAVQPPVDRLLAPATLASEAPATVGERALPTLGQPSWLRAAHAALSMRIQGRGRQVAAGLSLLVLATSLLAGRYALSRGGTLCLATDFPTSGIYTPIMSLEEAVNLAVAQHPRLDNGDALKAINYDDASAVTHDFNAEIGAHNVQRMVRDPCTVGMVGPGNSDVAVAEMPIAAQARLVMISPSNTRSGLTLRPYAGLAGWDFDQLHPPDKPLNYFRVCPNDVVQSLVAANYIFGELGARTVYVVHDREWGGSDVVGGFAQGFQTRGGQILGIESIQDEPSVDPAAIAAVATRIVRTHPEAVYYAGLSYGGGPLRAQLVADHYAGPFVGSQGIATDPGFVDLAGATADDSVAVAPAAYISGMESDAAAQFVRAFQARYPGQSVDPDTAEAYDAAMILVTAINHLIHAGLPVTRATVLEQVRQIHYSGVIGPISFDGNGDIIHGVFSILRVQNGVWTYSETVRV